MVPMKSKSARLGTGASMASQRGLVTMSRAAVSKFSLARKAMKNPRARVKEDTQAAAVDPATLEAA